MSPVPPHHQQIRFLHKNTVLGPGLEADPVVFDLVPVHRAQVEHVDVGEHGLGRLLDPPAYNK